MVQPICIHLGFDDEMLCAIARKSQMMGTLLLSLEASRRSRIAVL